MKWRITLGVAAFVLLHAVSAVAGERRPGATLIAPDEMRCIAWAAHHYHRPDDPISEHAFVDLVAAIRLSEGGRVGRISVNRNGSYDIGPMQINSTHLGQLQRIGISYDQLLHNACENIVVGAWILHSALRSSGDLWSRIGDYNSRTPVYNQAYQRRVWQQLQVLWARRSPKAPPGRAAG